MRILSALLLLLTLACDESTGRQSVDKPDGAANPPTADAQHGIGPDHMVPPGPACDQQQSPGGQAPPVVIILLGDGMGPDHVRAGSLARHGVSDGLFLQSAFAHHGLLSTASLDGITDSGASATAMGCGIKAGNYRVGYDSSGRPCRNVFELAHEHGLQTGLVTTAELTDATPAGFALHHSTRFAHFDLAQQYTVLRPRVMLGGGALYFESEGIDGDSPAGQLAATGYSVVTTAQELLETDVDCGLLGVFNQTTMTDVIDRSADSTEPTMAQMTAAALGALEDSPKGFLLLIENEGIDNGSHINNTDNVLSEVGAFDDAVAEAVAWSAGRENVTILVLADHETGALEIVDDTPTIRWGQFTHSDRDVDIFGSGPGADVFADQTRDNRWVHSVIVSRITGSDPVAPSPQ